jgi:hypothetical protein
VKAALRRRTYTPHERLQVLTVGGADRGADKNHAMNTAIASSFLNGPGVRCGTGWSSAGPERVIGAAGPLADLAALVPLGLPGVPGALQLQVEEAGSRRRAQKARNSRSGSASRRRRSARGLGSAAALFRS